MEDHGYIVLRFLHDEEWDSLFDAYPYIFGKSDKNGKESK
jgi:hypothetical protein